jgi:2-polyprenyl-3-methyl-5-hydroxy-6-metoxy-1,4-benzoquinol methylase
MCPVSCFCCFVCGGTDLLSSLKTGAYSVQVCSGCGLGVTHPFPEAEELQAINAETYPLDERVSTYLGKQNYFERRYRGYLQAIQRFVPTGRLLDVGCNLGLFLKVAIEHGYSVTGVEINEPCAVWGRTRWGLDVRAGALEDCGFGKGAFDVVTLFDVLEHVPNPRGLLRAVRPLLGGDGSEVVLVEPARPPLSLLAPCSDDAFGARRFCHRTQEDVGARVGVREERVGRVAGNGSVAETRGLVPPADRAAGGACPPSAAALVVQGRRGLDRTLRAEGAAAAR